MVQIPNSTGLKLLGYDEVMNDFDSKTLPTWWSKKRTWTISISRCHEYHR